MPRGKGRKSHVSLVGPSHKSEHASVWQGLYPRGLSQEEFRQLQDIRRSLEEVGASEADIAEKIIAAHAIIGAKKQH